MLAASFLARFSTNMLKMLYQYSWTWINMYASTKPHSQRDVCVRTRVSQVYTWVFCNYARSISFILSLKKYIFAPVSSWGRRLGTCSCISIGSSHFSSKTACNLLLSLKDLQCFVTAMHVCYIDSVSCFKEDIVLISIDNVCVYASIEVTWACVYMHTQCRTVVCATSSMNLYSHDAYMRLQKYSMCMRTKRYALHTRKRKFMWNYVQNAQTHTCE